MARVDAAGEPARVVALFWSAWILAVAAGMILAGMVDHSPLVAAMNGNPLFHACWIGIGSIVAGFAIAVASLALAWSAWRGAFRGRSPVQDCPSARRDVRTGRLDRRRSSGDPWTLGRCSLGGSILPA